jgi:hypothetical protein
MRLIEGLYFTVRRPYVSYEVKRYQKLMPRQCSESFDHRYVSKTFLQIDFVISNAYSSYNYLSKGKVVPELNQLSTTP